MSSPVTYIQTDVPEWESEVEITVHVSKPNSATAHRNQPPQIFKIMFNTLDLPYLFFFPGKTKIF